MGGPHADAFVFFGATDDLAFKKIFPALQGMVKRGLLTAPVIGVARSGDLDRLRTRARESLEKHGGAMSKSGPGSVCPSPARRLWFASDGLRRCIRATA